MIPLDVGDELVDREKSRIFLHYLAKSSKKWDERDVRHRKTEIAVQQFKKLNTKEIEGQLGTIEDHLQKALRQEKMLAEHQQKEGHTHDELQSKIKRLEHKLTRYAQTGAARRRRVRELDLKVRALHAHKTEHAKSRDRERILMRALGDLLSLKKQFGAQASEEQKRRIEIKMEKLKAELASLKQH